MTLRSVIDILALLVCSVYCTIPLFWLVIHPFIANWRRRGRRAYISILPIWAAFIALSFLLMWPYRFAHLYINRFAWVSAALFFFLGFSIYSAAFKSFDRAL